MPSTAYILVRQPYATYQLSWLLPAFPLLVLNVCTYRLIHWREPRSPIIQCLFHHLIHLDTLLTCKSSSIMFWSMHIHSSNLILSLIFPPSHPPSYPTLLTCNSIMLWSMHIHSSNLILSLMFSTSLSHLDTLLYSPAILFLFNSVMMHFHHVHPSNLILSQIFFHHDLDTLIYSPANPHSILLWCIFTLPISLYLLLLLLLLLLLFFFGGGGVD